jgi:hypothetical protein
MAIRFECEDGCATREYAVGYVEALEERVREMEGYIQCAYCGAQFEVNDERALRHWSECPNHPARVVIRLLEDLVGDFPANVPSNAMEAAEDWLLTL